MKTPDDAPATPAEQLRCGGASCADGEFCEERYKGHRIDDQGRPLERKKCMPLPAPCRSRPSCDCVREHVSFKHCREQNGRIHTDDYPR